MEDCADYKRRKFEEDEENDGEEEGEGEGELKRAKRDRDDAYDLAHLNLLVPNLELATGCSPSHLPGGPPSPLAQTLTQRIMTFLHSSNMLGMAPMRIWYRPDIEDPTFKHMGGDSEEMKDAGDADNEEEIARAEVKAFWVLYIDVLFISLDGNAFDAAWLAILAALRDTMLPRAWWDAERELVLCSDEMGEARGLEIREWPVPLSFGVFEGEGAGRDEGEGREMWVLVDTDGFEEGLCREVGTVVVGDGGKVLRLEKSGGKGAGMLEIRRLVGLAVKRREEWMRVLGIS